MLTSEGCVEAQVKAQALYRKQHPSEQTLFVQHKTAPTEATVAIIPVLIPLKVSCKPLGSGPRLPRTGFPIRLRQTL